MLPFISLNNLNGPCVYNMKPCFRWNGETCETWENKVKDIVMRIQERDFSPLLFSFFLSLYVFFKLTREDGFLSVSFFFSLFPFIVRMQRRSYFESDGIIERNFCFLFFFIFFQRNVLNLNETARAAYPSPNLAPPLIACKWNKFPLRGETSRT